MPRWLIPAFVLLVVASFLPLALIAKARSDNQRTPRINLIPDMDYQPKYLPQTRNDLFADGRAMRPEVAGTIARGHLADDDHYDRGYVDGDWATSIPSRAMEGAGSWEALVRRGQSRFEVYCSPCHGSSGNGQGMVSQRALELMDQGLANWTPPTSLHDELAVNRTDGHLFNTITNGIRNMPAYGSQVPTQDRWAIVSYVRALQRSQAATLDDVPADARETLR